jgi:transposase
MQFLAFPGNMPAPKNSKENRILLIELYAQNGKYSRTAEVFAGIKTLDPIPTRSAVRRVVQRWRATGTVVDQPRKRQSPATSPQMRASVLAAVSLNPIVSARSLANDAGISKSSVRKILKSEKFHPYRSFMLRC